MIVERVIEFRRKFGLPIPHEPTDIPPSDLILSCGFLEEEIIEFRTAMELRLIDARTEDDAAMFDALIDLVYFAVGMAINRDGTLKRASCVSMKRTWRKSWPASATTSDSRRLI